MSAFYFSASTGGFYVTAVHGDAMPADVVPVPPARHAQLLAAQATGAAIVAGASGRPRVSRPRLGLDERRAAVIAAVKREAGRRIERAVPAWRQANDNAELAIAALIPEANNAQRTNDILVRRDLIDRIRARSGEIEAAIADMPARALRVFDPRSDAEWTL